jgi:hypothetical protein
VNAGDGAIAAWCEPDADAPATAAAPAITTASGTSHFDLRKRM